MSDFVLLGAVFCCPNFVNPASDCVPFLFHVHCTVVPFQLSANKIHLCLLYQPVVLRPCVFLVRVHCTVVPFQLSATKTLLCYCIGEYARWSNLMSCSHACCLLLQDEDRDIYAVVTGLFEQTFTISKELASGGGFGQLRRMDSATRTEG